MLRRYYLPIIFATSLAAACQSEQAPTSPNFKTSVEAHLASVEGRDFETFKSTLTSSNNLAVIFPGGTQLATTEEVLDFHKEWFKDKDWVFDTEIRKVIEGSDQSTALVQYSFRDTPNGEPRHAWLVLTFQLEDNEWRLIHDQNTRIDK